MRAGTLKTMAAYGFAIFTGAFLLFQVQPLMGKYVLPWFGGATGVWTTCLLFFQVLLLAGYAYAHLSTRFLRPRRQVLIHLILVALAICTLPITPSDSWKPGPTTEPTVRIILLLAASLGLPYFVLSATAPLFQHWFSQTHPKVSPFRLYALSNAGSLLGLVTYPTVVEPWVTRSAQAALWGLALGVYALACGWCALKVWRSSVNLSQTDGPTPGSTARPAAGQRLLWIFLPACASVLLLAITNKICQDVAVIAFLWVLPLTIYLVSFIICFDRPAWYTRLGFGLALLAFLPLICWVLSDHATFSTPVQILIYLAGLFICCMVCHGEVYRLRPDPAYLTSFYFCIAAGGALGGTLVAVVAPVVFQDYFELHWGLILCGALFLVVWARTLRLGPPLRWPRLVWAGAALALLGLAGGLWAGAHNHDRVRTWRNRNFYGVLNVYRYDYPDPTLNQIELLHGRVAHGMQFLHPSRAAWPTLYYSPGSGIGQALAALPKGPRRIGVVGLGAGTLAAYARRGDQIRFYELNPEVEKVARSQFSFLRDSPGEVSVILGDARLSLEHEPPQTFDLLVLDAFNSDSVPVHLLTREAFVVYQRHLKTNGVIAAHVSNTSLNLQPVVANLARQFGYHWAVSEYPGAADQPGAIPSTWVVLSRDSAWLEMGGLRQDARSSEMAFLEVPLWTDDYSGLFPVLRWRELIGGGSTRGETFQSAADAVAVQGSAAATMASLRAAVRQEPNSPAALNNLACLLATASDPALRDGTEAVKLAEKACAITEQQNTVMLSTLAAAYAEAGRFDEAVATAERACSLAAVKGEQLLLDRNRQLLEIYRRKQPYHQSPP